MIKNRQRPGPWRAPPWVRVLVFLATIHGWAQTQAGNPTAEHPVLPPREALATFQLPEGFRIELVAAEPDLVNPMSMTLDERGRIYVSLSHTYRYGPEKAPVHPPQNPLVRLQLDRQGRLVQRVVVASGFEEPVMGLAVADGRLWATNLDRLMVTKLDKQGRAGPWRTIVRDSHRPWNPFGMYRIRMGPDGLLYLCVGDHPIKLTGRTNTVAVRGNTGGLFRLKPDGADIELLAQGVRAPFSMDLDPFGRLWLLSNGEGNPNRLIRVIPTADYHFQTRQVGWDWLAGDEPLAPPVWENPPGAHTAVVAYYSDAFPAAYWGNLLVSNWGAHGFPSANHVIVRHVLDDHGNVVASQPFLTTTDPRFRPTQITLAPDGNLYVLDWYGRDDESDLTGRLYKITYVGPDRSQDRRGGKHAGLGSRNHWVRRQAARRLLGQGPSALPVLQAALSGADPLAAAESLWLLRRSGWQEAATAMRRALAHRNWRVRRLAVELLGQLHAGRDLWQQMRDDPEPAVRLEAALLCTDNAQRAAALVEVLREGAAGDRHLRYRAALHLARIGEPEIFCRLLSDPDADAQLAGLIALDEAFYEQVRAGAARRAMAQLLDHGTGIPLAGLLAVACAWPDPGWRQPAQALLDRKLTALELARTLALLDRLGASVASQRRQAMLADLVRRVAEGRTVLASSEEKQALLQLLPAHRLDPAAILLLRRFARDRDAVVRDAAHQLLVSVGQGDERCTALCWQLIADPQIELATRLDALLTLSRIERQLDERRWQQLLLAPSRRIALAALRCLQEHADQAGARQLIQKLADQLASRGPAFAVELQFWRRHADPAAGQTDAPPGSKEALRRRLLEQFRQGDVRLGRLAFRRHVCYRCHQPGLEPVPLGPKLDGIAATNTPAYVIDSILDPSRVVKTGFATSVVVTKDGRVLSGKVWREGKQLVIVSSSLERTRVPLADVEQRKQTAVSLMPTDLETTMSEPELRDLVAYLMTQTGRSRPPAATRRPR